MASMNTTVGVIDTEVELRDLFAIEAMKVLQSDDWDDYHQWSGAAYLLADAMLKARKKDQ